MFFRARYRGPVERPAERQTTLARAFPICFGSGALGRCGCFICHPSRGRIVDAVVHCMGLYQFLLAGVGSLFASGRMAFATVSTSTPKDALTIGNTSGGLRVDPDLESDRLSNFFASGTAASRAAFKNDD